MSAARPPEGAQHRSPQGGGGVSAAARPPEGAQHRSPQGERIARVFSELSADRLQTLGQIYHPQARFVDPFNEVQGLAAIQGVFAHMYRNLDNPRFEVRQCLHQGRDCVLLWDFLFRLRRPDAPEHRVPGASHLQLDADGLILSHVDHWDPARGLYEKLPLLGAFMRWLRRRVAG